MKQFVLDFCDERLEPRYNVSPGQLVAAVRNSPQATGRQLCLLRWGLIPGWAKDPAIGYKLINARSETVAEKPSFRHAFGHRRCLIPADGYYEWRRSGGGTAKQPYYIRRRDEQLFAFAGLWESWRDEQGKSLETCTVITTEANELTSEIHPRMPAILAPQHYAIWLSDSDTTADLQACLQPFPSESLMMYPVRTLVNSPRNDTPDCIQPLENPPEEPPGPRQLSLL
jgi:putative SOS response-associated peptidase YedK